VNIYCFTITAILVLYSTILQQVDQDWVDQQNIFDFQHEISFFLSSFCLYNDYCKSSLTDYTLNLKVKLND